MAEITKRGRNWYYRFTDANGRRVMRKGCPDRCETERMATMAEAEAAKVRAGLVDPKASAYAKHEARPLAEHLADWHAYLIGRGSTRQHADLSRNRVSRLIQPARATRISNLTPSVVQAALKAVRDSPSRVRPEGRTRPRRLAPVDPPLHAGRQGVLPVALA
jgi:histone H3/H4